MTGGDDRTEPGPRVVVLGAGFAGLRAPDIAEPIRSILRRRRSMTVLMNQARASSTAAAAVQRRADRPAGRQR